ncbi:MAG: sensor histidine kinase [Bacteroidales bacterium]
MKKRLIFLLAVAATIATFCLIAFQLFWIGEVRKIKEEEFDQKVNIAFDNIISQLEEREVYFRIVNDISENNRYTFRNTKTGIRSRQTKQQLLTINLSDTVGLNRRFKPIADPVIVGQLYSTLKSIDNQQRVQAEHNSEKISLTESLKDKKILVDNITEKIISIEVPIEQRVSKELLDTLLRQEFQKNGFNFDISYAVYHVSGEFILGNAQQPLLNNKDAYVRQLFPNDLLSERYLLSLSFPRKSSYIFASMRLILLASIGLLAIVMSVFLSTIITILRQKKVSQMRSDFVSNMTHEFKTPIATIALASEMLADTNVPNERKNFTYLSTTIFEQTKRLTLLVERALQMAMFERGKLFLQFKVCEFHPLAQKAIDSLVLQLKNKDAQIVSAFCKEKPFVSIDEVHFTNILLNLIDNALKYTKEKPLINISTNLIGEQLQIQVSDNGIGIAKEECKHIFEQFYRVHTGNVHNVKGFGLGLSYVKKIVDLHGGNISVDSEVGTGTTFTILIPVVSVNA